MRAFLLLAPCLLLLGLAPGSLRADEPAAAPDGFPTPAAPAPEAAPAPDPVTTAPGAVPEAPRPGRAWVDLQNEVSALPRLQRPPALRSGAQSFLDHWAQSGQALQGEDHYFHGLFLRAVDRDVEAQRAFAAAGAATGVDATLVDEAATSEASLLGDGVVRATLGPDVLHAALERLLAYCETIDVPARASARTTLRGTLASLLELADRKEESLALRMRTVLDDPDSTGRHARSILATLMGSTHALGGYEAVRAAAAAVLPVLDHQHGLVVTAAQARLAAAQAGGQEPEIAAAERELRGAESDRARLDDARRPLGMLGEPAAAWTLDNAYGDVASLADLRGRVVVLDFWATWCPWCIKSFPAIRDLLRDYEARGLSVVGVTASASAVYAQRYDLDDDLKDRVVAGQRPTPAARLANARMPADGETVLEPDAYRAKEQEVLATFIANHGMTWPVVMIDADEPGPKYALTGWPHAVVIDRAGRVRYFKSGALLRDRPEAVAAFRRVLEDLLAETVPGSER